MAHTIHLRDGLASTYAWLCGEGCPTRPLGKREPRLIYCTLETMAKRALITGITGQDGFYLAELFLDQGLRSLGHGAARPVRRNYWRIEHLLDRITLKPGRSARPAVAHRDSRTQSRPDEIYNLAAMSFVPASWDQPMLTGEFKSLGITACWRRFAGQPERIGFYQASSSEMFGKVREMPQTERTPFHPRSPYGVAKVFGH